MEVEGIWKRGRPRIRWVDIVRCDIREKGLSRKEVYDRATQLVKRRPDIKVGLRLRGRRSMKSICTNVIVKRILMQWCNTCLCHFEDRIHIPTSQ